MSFTPHRQEVVPLAREYADRELEGKIKSFTMAIRRKFQKRVPPEYQDKNEVTLGFLICARPIF